MLPYLPLSLIDGLLLYKEADISDSISSGYRIYGTDAYDTTTVPKVHTATFFGSEPRPSLGDLYSSILFSASLLVALVVMVALHLFPTALTAVLHVLLRFLPATNLTMLASPLVRTRAASTTACTLIAVPSTPSQLVSWSTNLPDQARSSFLNRA